MLKQTEMTVKLLFFVFLATFCLSGCSQDKQAQEQVTITFAYQDRVADAASIIAVKKGFFEEQGLVVKPMIFSSGPACTEALVYGNADFGTMGDTTAIITISKGTDFSIVASHGGGEQRHRIIVAANSTIQKLNDLTGKRIGIKKGTSTHGGFEQFTRSKGMDLSHEMIDMRPKDQLLALAAGELDALVASEPTPSKAEADGFGRELATLGGLGNSYPIFILVNTKFASAHPDAVVKMLKGLKKAQIFIKEHPEEAIAIQAAQSGLPPEVIGHAMGYHYYQLTLDTSTIKSLTTTALFLQKIGKIAELPDWNQAIDPSFLQQMDQK